MQYQHFKFILLITFGLCCLSLCAQTTDEELLAKADRFYRERKYMNALSSYEDAIGMNRNNQKALFGAAICYLQLDVPENAYEYLKMVNQSQISQLEDFHFWYAKVCYMNANFDSALIHINTYAAKTGTRYEKEAAQLITLINDAFTVSRIRNNYTLENAGEQINTQASEMNVLVGRDVKKILFTRSTREINLKNEGKKSDGKEEVFKSELKNDDKWQTAVKVNNKLNSGGEDLAIQLLEEDKQLLVCQNGDLKTMEFVNGEWRTPFPIAKGINTGKEEVHGFIYDFGTRIIFASNATTKGDLDLFESTLKRDGSWNTPVPLVAINTDLDENTPYVMNNGKTLYFSSKGHYSMGGYDVFKSEYDENKKQWSKPVNLGSPINSVSDDMYFMMNENIGYLTSNRIGGMGEFDIYRVYLFSKVKISGRVYNRTSGHVLGNCLIKFILDNEIVEATTNESGNYETELPFHKPVHVKVYSQNKALYEETLKITINPKRPKVINRNYYIDYSEKEIPESNTADVKPETGALYATGFITDSKTGKPLDAIVQLLDPATDQVLKTTSTDMRGHYSMYLGAHKGNLVVEASKKGYVYKSTEFNTSEAGTKTTLDLNLLPVEGNTSFVLQGINFESNSDVLKSSSFAELNKLFLFLNENSEVKVEISGHTDNVGNPVSNLRLSEDRAKSVGIYLINKGIDKNRILTTGYGETKPIATNSQEEDGRELNRRIEVKIMK